MKKSVTKNRLNGLLHHPISLSTTTLVSIALVIIALLIYASVLSAENGDITSYVRPWFAQIATRGFPALSGEYADYTPSYLYLLALANLLGHGSSDTVLIKAVSISFTVATAVLVGLLVRRMGRDNGWSLLSGCGFLLLPTVFLNSAYWGQSDIIYTSFLVASLLASINRLPLLNVLCFGVALSFKLQTVFLAPYLLYLLLRREIPWHYIVIIPLIYALAMIPAWLAGRPWDELLLVYVSQASNSDPLSMYAPNLYVFAQWLGYGLGLNSNFKLGFGLAIAAVASVIIPAYALRLRGDEAKTKLLIATTTALLIPFLLPKMHDRYFFVADVMTFVLACVLPRFWWLAVMMQAASAAAYLPFLFDVHWGPYVGALFSTFAVIRLVWVLYLCSKSQATPGAPTFT